MTAVNDFCLNVKEGECFSFLGPSGCGKTTTLRMIAGFEDLSDGSISLCGKVVSDKKRISTFRRRSGAWAWYFRPSPSGPT